MTGRSSSLDSLRDRLKWLQARQSVIATNVAHADTPGFRPRDLAPQAATAGDLPLRASAAGHSAAGTSSGMTQRLPAKAFETRPSGNAVNLEEEMLKLSETQIEHQLAAGLYQKSLAYMRLALGRKG